LKKNWGLNLEPEFNHWLAGPGGTGTRSDVENLNFFCKNWTRTEPEVPFFWGTESTTKTRFVLIYFLKIITGGSS
jgi:hypothetical protein